MAARYRLKVWRVCNFTENATSLLNVYLLKYITGNLRHVKRFSDGNSRIPQVEVPFSNG
jgi:hypothetical protein